jgi:hypothetical protein
MLGRVELTLKTVRNDVMYNKLETFTNIIKNGHGRITINRGTSASLKIQIISP